MRQVIWGRMNVISHAEYNFGCRKIYNIRRTETQTLNDSRLVLQLSLPNTLNSDVKSRMKM